MPIFFNSWDSVLRVFITAIITYPLLILALRLSGKRSLSKLNMFDFVVTIGIGSTFGAIIIYESITIFDGIITIALLLIGQAIISRISVSWEWYENLLKSDPTLIYFDREFKEDAMKTVRVTRADILAESRQAGYACMDDVYAVVLETNGVISVIGEKDNISQPTLEDVLST